MAVIGKDIAEAKQLLSEGELVAIPTETVYGLAGNALNDQAVAKIFEAKNRPSFDPLILHTDSLEKVKSFVREIPQSLEELAKAFWPGPLTLLFPKKEIISDLVTAGLDRVAVRIPQHPIALELLGELDFPLAAPSANPFGYISPTQAGHVQAQLGDKIQYILDGGACQVGLESTIVGMEEDQVVIYRMGGLDLREIEKIVGKVEVRSHSSSNPAAPGLLKSHYAPRKPFLVGDLEKLIPEYLEKGERFAVLSLARKFLLPADFPQYQLSESADLAEAARHLFGYMRSLDESDVNLILAEWMPEEGLGRAINDRLRRAAALG
ncbi:L-threonylcarbamoyladenylate synthase [Algoriphagus formosus]|uniref:Threonylcarbamoyl-AMP synthase n=1 Tax=Algoriphagus formosus TaxID=2007308 RepID=A0A4R5UZE6_9BACT|nr:L-threonylcarbamoyladenylate synthase [Algoriphagus aquimaris]TDK44803.1 threonylcarbamoyl-AMP synthase [Algoriphagus aquimaris]